MNPALACAALATSLPVASVGWVLGAVLDRSGASPGQRHGIWEAAFWAAPLAAAAVLIAPRLPATTVLRLHALGASAATSVGLSVGSHAPSAAVIVMALALGGAALRLTSLALRLRRLRLVRDRAERTLGDTAGLPVRLSDDVGSPVLAGLWRPIILLPVRFAANEAAETVALVCRHEAAHARRRDNLRLVLEEVAMAVLWFNPMLATVRARLSDVREEVCDAEAVAGLDPRERRLYARSLLDCLEARASTLPVTGLIGLNRRSTTMRIDAILSPKPRRHRIALSSGLLARRCRLLGERRRSPGRGANARRRQTGRKVRSDRTSLPTGSRPTRCITFLAGSAMCRLLGSPRTPRTASLSTAGQPPRRTSRSCPRCDLPALKRLSIRTATSLIEWTPKPSRTDLRSHQVQRDLGEIAPPDPLGFGHFVAWAASAAWPCLASACDRTFESEGVVRLASARLALASRAASSGFPAARSAAARLRRTGYHQGGGSKFLATG